MLRVLRANISRLVVTLRREEEEYRNSNNNNKNNNNNTNNNINVTTTTTPSSPTTRNSDLFSTTKNKSPLGPESNSPTLKQRRNHLRRRSSSRLPSKHFVRICRTFQGLHALLLSLIEAPLQVTQKTFPEDSARLIVKEAAMVIKVGFELFYPTTQDCNSLLQHAMEGQPNTVRWWWWWWWWWW
tara:strand:- start:673 stop:1224 length:552 start_codon:yes stop_codon:yes gene_type:complete